MTKRRGSNISPKAAKHDPGLCIDPDAPSVLIHASAVCFREKGIVLLGPSGSGKSDLALRMIDAGAVLIADDQVKLQRAGDRLLAKAPDKLAGLIELRGQGIMRSPHQAGYLDLAVDLQPYDKHDERLPELERASWLGVDMPKINLDARASSAVVRIKMSLEAERVF